MKTNALFASLTLLCVVASGLAQTQPQGPPPPMPRTSDQSQDKDDVVRITTNLVQIDAIVTKDGKPVPTLKAEDFEIFEDGKKQTITSFSYISNVPVTSPAVTDTANRDKSVPAAPLKRDDPRRTLAIVVDDLGLSAESMSQVRRQLRKFVDEQIQPHDLVAIIRTGTQLGALQQFTNDKRLLNRAVDQLRWNPCNRTGISVLPPTQRIMELGTTEQVCGGFSFFSTMKSLGAIIDGMAELAGRKSLMILSDSLPTETQDSPFFNVDPNSPFNDATNRVIALQRIAERAIRASVVIYSIDTQGLQTTLARSLFEAGLIDEVGFNIHPVLLGSGIPLFHEMRKQIDLKLIKCQQLKNGCVVLTYRVKH